MRLQSKSSVRYVFNNFFYLLPFVIVPAVMLTFFMRERGPMLFLADVLSATRAGEAVVFKNFYKDIYSCFSLINAKESMLFGINAVWFWILTMVITVFGLCLSFYAVERHIRFGTRKLGGLFANVNESVMYVAPFMLLIFAVYEIWMLFLSGAIALLNIICTGWAFFVLAVALTFLFYFLFFVALSLFLLTPVSMYFDGYKFGFAASYSAQLTTTHFADFVLPIICTVICTQLFIGLSRLVPQAHWLPDSYSNLVSLCVRFLCYLWWLVYIPGFTACKYASYTETKRADLKIKLFD